MSTYSTYKISDLELVSNTGITYTDLFEASVLVSGERSSRSIAVSGFVTYLSATLSSYLNFSNTGNISYLSSAINYVSSTFDTLSTNVNTLSSNFNTLSSNFETRYMLTTIPFIEILVCLYIFSLLNKSK